MELYLTSDCDILILQKVQLVLVKDMGCCKSRQIINPEKVNPQTETTDCGSKISQGSALKEKGKFKDAMNTFSEVIDKKTTDTPSQTQLFEAYLKKGECQLELKLYVSAYKSFQKALEIDPNNQTAIKHFDRIKHLTKIIITLGSELKRLFRYKEALDNFLKVIDFKASDAPSKGDLIEAYVGKGDCELETKDYESAFMSFKKVLQLDPSHVQAKENLESVISLMVGELDPPPENPIDYIKHLTRIIITQGFDLKRQLRFKEALKRFLEVIDFKTSDAPSKDDLVEAYVGKGECELETNDYVSAFMSFKRVLQLDPSHAQAKEHLEPTRSQIERELKDAAERPVDHYRLGLLLMCCGKERSAMHYFQEAIRFNIRPSDSHVGIGNIYLSQQKRKEAIASFKKAIETDPVNFSASRNLTDCLVSVQQMQEANSFLQGILNDHREDAIYSAIHKLDIKIAQRKREERGQ